MNWDITSVMVEVGGTATATYTGLQPTKERLDALLNGKATAEVSSGAVTFTGVSAGEVTIPAYSWVSSSTYSGNAITISVTAPADDESYLNKRGLAHFWENIDGIKQDKLTAGAGISITGNTISTTANTFASYSSGTLYITNTAQNADTENF